MFFCSVDQRLLQYANTVGGMTKRFNQTLGPRDQQKPDQYLTAVRELENGIQQREGWVNRPKPQNEMAQPRDVNDRFDIIAQTHLMHDLITLALQTDSTRIICEQPCSSPV